MTEKTATISETRGFSAFTLKLIAILGMTCQHSAIVFGTFLPPNVAAVLYTPGGLTFPIMAYFLVEGYRYTRDVKKYALRLLLFALLAYYPFYLLFSTGFNVLFTLHAGLTVLMAYERMKSRELFWLLFVVLVCVTYLYFDWGGVGVVMVFISYKLKPATEAARNNAQNAQELVGPPRSKAKRVILPLVLPWLSAIEMLLSVRSFAYVLPWLLFYLVGCTATIPLLMHYNGQRGPSMKYLFYAYYPAHLLVLAVIRNLISP